MSAQICVVLCCVVLFVCKAIGLGCVSTHVLFCERSALIWCRAGYTRALVVVRLLVHVCDGQRVRKSDR